MELSLHVYHLDEGPEADEVVALLTEAGVSAAIDRPTAESNAILVPVILDPTGLEEWQVRQAKLVAGIELLRRLRPEPLKAARALGLATAARIHTPEFYLPLPAEFVRECGRLGLEICVLNESVL
jgi:hypothetical protein